MTSKDPTRWLESGEAPEPLQRLLEKSRAELGTRTEIDALAQSLARVLGPSAGLEALPQPSPAVAGPVLRGLGRWRWLAAVGGITSAVAVCWWMGGAAPSTPPHDSSVASVAQLPPLVPAPDLHLATTALSNTEPDAGARPSSDPATASPVARPRRAPVRATPSEAKLLEQAHALLPDRPARALALTREHRRRFPHGALSEEREVIAIEALERLGQHRAASDEAGAFETRFHDSVHQSHLEQTPLVPNTASKPTH